VFKKIIIIEVENTFATLYISLLSLLITLMRPGARSSSKRFPGIGVHRCATGFEKRFLFFGGCVRTAIQSSAAI